MKPDTYTCTKTPSSLPWVSQKFFQGRDNVNIFLIINRLLIINCKWTFTKCFILHLNENALCYGNSHKNCVSLAHQCFSHSIKLRGYCYQQALSHCIAHQNMSAFNSRMQQHICYRNLKWTLEDSLQCHCYSIKRPAVAAFNMWLALMLNTYGTRGPVMTAKQTLWMRPYSKQKFHIFQTIKHT